jgi:hypothetical protein
MRQLITFGLLLLTLTTFGQKKSETIKSKYSGVYSYGTDIEKSNVGTITIYHESGDTFLFYIELYRGAPSYNMGSLYGRLQITNDTGTFYSKLNKDDNGCKWTFTFKSDILTIRTVDNLIDCGFGNGVIADGNFKKQPNKSSDNFIDMEGKTIYFKNIKPEDYYKD